MGLEMARFAIRPRSSAGNFAPGSNPGTDYIAGCRGNRHSGGTPPDLSSRGQGLRGHWFRQSRAVHWLPELRFVPKARVHTPWDLKSVEQGRFQVKIGEDYPAPLVDLFRSAKENEVLYDKAIGKTSKGKSHRNKRRY